MKINKTLLICGVVDVALGIVSAVAFNHTLFIGGSMFGAGIVFLTTSFRKEETTDEN